MSLETILNIVWFAQALANETGRTHYITETENGLEALTDASGRVLEIVRPVHEDQR